MNPLYLRTASGLLALLAVGCTSTRGNFVEFSDPDLAYAVELGPAVAERLEASNNLKVIVPIKNITDEQVQLLVQMEFRDANDYPIGDNTPSRVMILERGASKDFSATSLNPVAMAYKMRLRWNR